MAAEFDNVLEGIDLGEELEAEDLTADAGAEPEPKEEPEPEAADEGEEPEAAEEEQPPEQPPAKGPAKPAKSDSVPLATHLETKHQLRDLKLRLAQLEAERIVPQPPQPTEPEKSPLEAFLEKEGDDAVPTAKVLLEQSRWEHRQAQQQQQTGADSMANRAVAVAVRSMTDDVMGEGLGFETLLQIGNTFLTPGDIVDIKAAGAKAGEVMYQRLLERTIRSGTPQGKLIKAAYIQSRKANAASTPKTPTPKAKTPAGTRREAPTREEVIGAKAQLQGADDLTDFFFG